MSIQIVTDSTAYLTREFAHENSIHVVPLSVYFEGETKDEGFPGEFEEFYTRLKTSKNFPVTSQPSIDAFYQVFKKIVEAGDEVITLVISSKLSGTYNSALAAAQMVDPDRISIIDSECSVSNLKVLVIRALELVSAGAERADIVKKLEVEKKRMGIYLTVDNLDYLKKGGRLSGAEALIGSVLNIKPIIALADGKLIPAGKVRGKNKAIETLISYVPENVKKIGICHILDYQEAEEVKKRLEALFPNAEIFIDELGPVIGAHLGPKAIGICYSF